MCIFESGRKVYSEDERDAVGSVWLIERKRFYEPWQHGDVGVGGSGLDRGDFGEGLRNTTPCRK